MGMMMIINTMVPNQTKVQRPPEKTNPKRNENKTTHHHHHHHRLVSNTFQTFEKRITIGLSTMDHNTPHITPHQSLTFLFVKLWPDKWTKGERRDSFSIFYICTHSLIRSSLLLLWRKWTIFVVLSTTNDDDNDHKDNDWAWTCFRYWKY